MGRYPSSASNPIELDASSDITSLMRDDAAGRIDFSAAGRDRDIHLGQAWIEAAEAEPALKAKIVRAAVDMVASAVVAERYLALEILRHVTDKSVPGALRRAFEANPKAFVGVTKPDVRRETLFLSWLGALGHNLTVDRAEAKKAVAAAAPFLALEEAGNYSIILHTEVGTPFQSWLPAALAHAADQRYEAFASMVPKSEWDDALAAMATAPAADRTKLKRVLEKRR